MSEMFFKKTMIAFVEEMLPLKQNFDKDMKLVHSTLKSHTDDIKVLKNEMQELKEEKNTDSQEIIEKHYSEFVEREKRSKNILIHKVPETIDINPETVDANSQAVSSYNEDINKVKNILKVFNEDKYKLNICLENIKIKRIGQPRD